jgi:TorA maturation chaperone TorD
VAWVTWFCDKKQKNQRSAFYAQVLHHFRIALRNATAGGKIKK